MVEFLGLELTEVSNPWSLREGESVVAYPDASEARQPLADRAAAIRRLVRAEKPSLTDRERDVLRALRNQKIPVNAWGLAVACNCHRRTLYKPGGLKDLIARGLVSYKPRLGFEITSEGRASLDQIEK